MWCSTKLLCKECDNVFHIALPEPHRISDGNQVTEKTSPNLSLDTNDPVYATLTQCAKRISQLLAAPTVTANSDVESSLDDFLGAVYALIIAKRKNFQDRPDRPINIKPVAQRADRMAAGNVKTDGLWIAGFYFNNALSARRPSTIAS